MRHWRFTYPPAGHIVVRGRTDSDDCFRACFRDNDRLLGHENLSATKPVDAHRVTKILALLLRQVRNCDRLTSAVRRNDFKGSYQRPTRGQRGSVAAAVC